MRQTIGEARGVFEGKTIEGSFVKEVPVVWHVCILYMCVCGGGGMAMEIAQG